MADDNKPEEGEKSTVPFGAEITNLASVAIQVHEVFVELQKSGFTRKEALNLAGVLLASSSTIDMENYTELGEVGVFTQDLEIEDDFEVIDEEEFGNWDIIFKEHDEENPEDTENLE